MDSQGTFELVVTRRAKSVRSRLRHADTARVVFTLMVEEAEEAGNLMALELAEMRDGEPRRTLAEWRAA